MVISDAHGDRNLTDEDGPYIELMAGVYTDNQPDFTWLQPYEEKSFVQYFLPYRELGVVKNASKDLLLNVEQEGESSVRLKIFATSRQLIRIRLVAGNQVLFDQEQTLSPEEVFEQSVEIGNVRFQDLHLSLLSGGREVLGWQCEPDEVKPIPEPAEPACFRMK